MGRTPWATYLWPGFPQVWKRGSPSAVSVAVGFAVLVNLALLGSLVWSELFTSGVRNIVWVVVAVVWVVSVVLGTIWDRRRPAAADDLFGGALDHYLQQDWYQAERILTQLLRHNARDLDARLMVATLYRHTGRGEEAAGELDRLARMEGSRKWELEIGRERRLLAEAATELPHGDCNVRTIHGSRAEGDATGQPGGAAVQS